MTTPISRAVVLGLSSLTLAVAAPAQKGAANGALPPAQQALVDKRDKKLDSEFLKKAKWQTDYDKALAAAKKSKKLIFAYFTRSYSP